MKAFFSLVLICASILYAPAGNAKESRPMVAIRKIPILSRCQLERAKSIQYLGNNKFNIIVTPDCESDTIIEFYNKSFNYCRIDSRFNQIDKNKYVSFAYDKNLIAVFADKRKTRASMFDFYFIYDYRYKKLLSAKNILLNLQEITGICLSVNNRLFIEEDDVISILDSYGYYYSDFLIKDTFLNASYYDIERNIEYSAWKKDNKYYFKAYVEEGYRDISTYDRGLHQEDDVYKSRSFIIKDDFFIFEQLDTYPPEEYVYEVRIMHLGPGKEAVEVGSFVIEKAETPKKLIALPDGWFALMFRNRPGVIKFKPGESTYYWWVFDPAPEDYGMRAKDFVFAEGSFWLVGDDFPTAVLVEVPEKALQKAEFARK